MTSSDAKSAAPSLGNADLARVEADRGRLQPFEALEEAENRLRTVFEHAIEGIFQTTPAGRIIDANPALVSLLGYDSREQLIAEVTNLAQQLYVHPEDRDRARTLVEHDGVMRDFELQFYTRDGSMIWVAVNASVIRDEAGQVASYMGTVRDITQQKRAQHALQHQARHDSLTGLPTRAVLQERIVDLLERSRQQVPPSYALFFLDFDHFKFINDSLGHDFGDNFLQQVGQRLQHFCERTAADLAPTVACTTTRLGGDEFAMLVTGPLDEPMTARIADRLVAAMSDPYLVKERPIPASASVGVATSQLGHDSPEAVLRDADRAMYQAKEAGKGCYVVFDRPMQQAIQQELKLAEDLRWALDRDQFEVHYQPIICLRTCDLIGLEALLRWDHPEHGLLEAEQFLRLAEQAGFMGGIGWWLLKTVCADLQTWARQDPQACSQCSVTVNLSRRQLLEPNLVENIHRLTADKGIDPDRLILEISEATIVDGGSHAQATMSRLRQLGFDVWMDDFGTGHSMLSQLHHLPISGLKLDNRLVANLEQQREYSAVAHAIANLAHNLRLRMIGEGVETNAQLMQLMTLEIDYAQGRLFSPPEPAARIPSILHNPAQLRQAR